jgi:hypothetical protein
MFYERFITIERCCDCGSVLYQAVVFSPLDLDSRMILVMIKTISEYIIMYRKKTNTSKLGTLCFSK